jgi:hypothetical protein
MAVEEVTGQPWTRKHDEPGIPLIASTEETDYFDSLLDLIHKCQNRAPGKRFHAAGSHWELSDAAVSDDVFIETNNPRPGSADPVMSATLTNVIPSCLNPDYLRAMATARGLPLYLVHVEAGKRIYQLYAELDQPVDPDDLSTLAGVLNHHYGRPEFRGPHGFNTLGGAGGQTVVGALNTGTHGGDFDRPPLADSVVALHLVADGGKHYWIEPDIRPPLTDDFLMSVQFRGEDLGGPGNFALIRDTNLFNAVLVSAGRFGVIYSVVLQARPQYQLHEKRRLQDWQDIKDKIKDHDSDLYNEPGVDSHFLQVVICLTKYSFFGKNLAGVTKRWTTPISGPDPDGRSWRVGSKMPDSDPSNPVFDQAGNSHCYSPDPSKSVPGTGSFLDIACSDASFMKGLLESLIPELEDFVRSHGAAVGATIAAVAATGGGAGLLRILAGILAVVDILNGILDHFPLTDRFGQLMNTIKNLLLDPDRDPVTRAAGLFVWQCICFVAFRLQQGDQEYEAISYAVMDQHDYLDVGCNVNVDSLEVFFDSLDDRLIGFVDALINFEQQLEYGGKATLGYASIRFTMPSQALLGMQKHPITAAVEVACLKDVTGGEDLVTFASTLARDPNFNALVHWGQRNDYTLDEVQHRYGDGINAPPGDLGAWRAALASITANGRLDGFSNAFTRRTGLEVVSPKVGSVTADVAQAALDQTVTISWNAVDNPAGTTLSLIVAAENGAQLELFGNLSLQGSQTYQIAQHGVHHFTVQTSYTFSSETRVGSMTQDVQVA